MAYLYPNDLDRLMNWERKLHSGIEYAGSIKNWILGRSSLIFVIFMLLLSIILHHLQYVGY